MRSRPISHDIPAAGSIGRRQVLLWILAGIIAVFAGGAATSISDPYLAGLLAAGLVVLFFVWRRLEPMVPFLLLVAAIQGGSLLKMPLGDAPITTLMPVLGAWTLLAALFSGTASRRMETRSRAGRWLVPSLVALAVIIAITALAQTWRLDGRLLSRTEVLTLVQLGILVVVAVWLLSTPRRVLWVAYVTVGAGAAVAVVALADRLGLVTLGSELAYVDGQVRVSGLLGDPNFFSFQLLVSLAFAVHLILGAKTLFSRLLLALALVLILSGIVSTYSAGALVGAVAVLLTAVILQFRLSAKRALLAFSLIIAASVVVAATAPPGYTDAVAKKYAGITNSSSFEQVGTKRGAAWEAGARQFLANPVVGVGLSTKNLQAAIASHYTLSLVERKAAHNTFLSVAVGAGVGGLIAFLLMLGSSFSALWGAYGRAAREGDRDALLATGCQLTALVVVFTQGLQLDLHFEKHLWLLVGAALASRYWPAPAAAGTTEGLPNGD